MNMKTSMLGTQPKLASMQACNNYANDQHARCNLIMQVCKACNMLFNLVKEMRAKRKCHLNMQQQYMVSQVCNQHTR